MGSQGRSEAKVEQYLYNPVKRPVKRHSAAPAPTTLRLQNVNSNIAIDDPGTMNLLEKDKFLRSFDESEAKWAADFAKLMRASFSLKMT